MSSALIALFSALWLYLGNRFYGRFIENKLVKPRNDRATPAHSRNDGVDFYPSNPFVLFGHHFSSIAGAGPIVGPIIATAAFGWMAGLIWILLGSVFIGAVHDYLSLAISIRFKGTSISDATRSIIGKRSWILFQLFIWFTLILIIAVFIDVAARSFVARPEIVLPGLGLIPLASLFGILVYRMKFPLWAGTAIALLVLGWMLYAGQFLPVSLPGDDTRVLYMWYGILAFYGWLASILPVWILLQPRDYIANWVLFIGIAAAFLGLLYTDLPVTAPAFTGFVGLNQAGPLFPMLFILIACGAVSGFHSMVSSGTTSKQIDQEKHARVIGYGGMIMEGFVAVVALLSVSAGLYWSGSEPAGSPFVFQDFLKQSPIVAFGAGFGRFTEVFFGPYGMIFGMTMLNAFVMTTLDTTVRLSRFVTTELAGEAIPIFKNRYIASSATVIPAFFITTSGTYTAIWPMFAASNQMIASLALFVISAYLVGVRRPSRYTLIPAIFMLGTTMTALVWQGYVHLFEKGNYLLGGISVVLFVLAFLVALDARKAIGSYRRGDAGLEAMEA